MRWRLPGARSTLPASVALLLLPTLVAPQQQPELHDSASASRVSVPLADGTDTTHHAATIAAPPIVKSNDASALATLALAGSGRAVRAPPSQASTSAGLVSQLNARSLQDWEVEDFVLMATVDGTIHARDRKTGSPRWALEVPSSPLVESIYHRANRSSSSFDETHPEEDFLWIVEPSQDGSLYIYSPGENAGLQKLGLTVKQLVDETPYSGYEPAVTYTARKETTLYTIDARTGSILRVFSSRGPFATRHECQKVDGQDLDLDDEECETTSGTLVLGRVEYAVAIQNTETGDPICTLKYSEWAPNNRDIDLQGQYFQTMDQSHIYSMYDGVVLGFDHSRMDRPRYTQRFSSPVARVFDVVRQRPANKETQDASTPLVLLSQPLQPPDPDYASDDRDQRVFIDSTSTGGWFALSEETYPLVTGRAPMAQCYNKDFFRRGQPLMSLTQSQQRDALAGVHSLSGPTVVPPVPRIASTPEASNDTPRDVLRSELALPPALRHSTIIRKSWDNALDIVVTMILLFIGTFIYLNSHHIRDLAKQKLDLKNIINSNDKSFSTPATPIVGATPDIKRTSTPLRDATAGLVPEVTIDHVDVDMRNNFSDNDATPRPSRDQSTPPESGPRVQIREPSRGPDEGDDKQENDKPKKKRSRGSRGGKAHRRKGAKPGSENGMSEQNNQLTPNASIHSDHGVPLARTVSSDVVDMTADGVVRIGRLEVFTDVVLGHGSHGTVVYRGVFDGRNVAIKRMLMEFYDIASHEVGLLQESDDHHNVIRYFCREQAAGFLYIGLELCPASLQDIIERPSQFPELIQSGLDMPDILRQITQGVRYLHSLKIVHRDLKPQNILVAMPRGRKAASKTAARALRLLISDFGLCKKLEDNQSSFRATTAHAAGTSGWRAPELLVDDDAGPLVQNIESQHTETSEPAVVDPQTNRRATRAIDIFSLGCVFYYVLTRGGHPFDKNGKFMREANIVKDRLGDYAFEAKDLISSMLSLDPRHRPDASGVLTHPFFWPPSDRLSFLCDVSDHFEFEPREPPSEALLCLESVAQEVIGPEMDFLKVLPRDFKDNLGKQRKYTGSRMLDLLRALRNKKNHYNDMPDQLKMHIGGLPEGYLNFWTVRFPSLLMCCHWVVVDLGLTDTDRFHRYFSSPDE
ncbi:Serine/threonine-protein kinase ppk4 [Penicillium waksmanii]|uniref:Serine/threonine-protein kinase ppk4 n=1 Tax=Penicillium waksmanii TaxID=69791 RepID=UPI002547B073|nr:Serine/threonine-protein kinase ppk4 [Penicillium waksmanii]KAJ5989623.1 Serine/threonine-protein kinase ppk4 [Penicillium waksmanii]